MLAGTGSAHPQPWVPVDEPEKTSLVVPGNQTGLTALYFNNSTLAGKPVLQRRDGAPNFDWGKEAPASTVSADYFSVRWVGWLIAPTTGSYSFSVRADERVRLWVGGQKVLDTWDGTGQLQPPAYVTLAAGETTTVKMEYHSEEGNAHVQLQWVPPGQARQAIPAQMFSSESNELVAATVAGTGNKQSATAKRKIAPATTQSTKITQAKAAPATLPAPQELAGVYTLKARTTGQPLVVADEHQLGTEDATVAPHWRIEPAGQGYYRVAVQGGTKVLEVLGSSSSNGAALNLWPYYSGNNQLWQIKEVGDGYYTLVAKHSRKALTAKSPAEGGVQQWRANGHEDQQWRLNPVKDKVAQPVTTTTPLVGNGTYNVSLSPNPANSISQLRYQLPDAIPVGWVLYDARGIVVRTSDYRRATSGVHQQTLLLSALPNGNYQLHLTVGTITTTQPILIRHPLAETQTQTE
ncbi:RICIN domain-containing protein [Hymenobacter sp. BT507]|uniref:RICIN domain-containing protein n=1 Tax=Hymenobacter citatus TaxID=2763506 RepID=A0ABR7MMB9_9BACT|nr:PA14 domain-containing protein [Hymenobacter citatus]MBC6612234.1 RICIN domain-containing protein [Hymenobacter citatus]